MFAYRRSLRKGHSPNFHYLTRAITGKRDLLTSLSRVLNRKVRFFQRRPACEKSLKRESLRLQVSFTSGAPNGIIVQNHLNVPCYTYFSI